MDPTEVGTMTKGRDVGTVYVLKSTHPGLAKVGLTRHGTPEQRAENYTKVHGLIWQVYWSAPTQNVGKVEAACHHALATHSVAGTAVGMQEVFKVSPAYAREIAQRYVVAPSGWLPWRQRLQRWAGRGNRFANWGTVALILLASVLG
jgi:hypothetical protein